MSSSMANGCALNEQKRERNKKRMLYFMHTFRIMKGKKEANRVLEKERMEKVRQKNI